MSYRERVDQHSEKFLSTWTRPKHQQSQINGQTQASRSTLIRKSDAKAHRFF